MKTERTSMSVLSLKKYFVLACILVLSLAYSGFGSRVLFIVNSTTLPVGDSVVNALLVSQGHVVTKKAASASLTSDTLNQDLVMISSTVTTSAVGTKFRDVTKPVFMWECGLYDEMMMTAATGANGNTGGLTQIKIINSAHAMAAGLAAGMQTVYTSADHIPVPIN